MINFSFIGAVGGQGLPLNMLLFKAWIILELLERSIPADGREVFPLICTIGLTVKIR
jgi:hypothetical protein